MYKHKFVFASELGLFFHNSCFLITSLWDSRVFSTVGARSSKAMMHGIITMFMHERSIRQFTLGILALSKEIVSFILHVDIRHVHIQLIPTIISLGTHT